MDHSEDPAPLSGRLVPAFAARTIPEGLLVRSLLESQGVPVFVKGESEGPYRLGPVYLWVPEEFEVQAGIIIAEARAGSSGNAGEDVPEPATDPGPDRQIDR